MPWTAYIIHFIAAAFLTNGVPHFVNGVSGRPFRTPFVRLQGAKLSSPVTNVIWGWFNFLVAFLLFTNLGRFISARRAIRFLWQRAFL